MVNQYEVRGAQPDGSEGDLYAFAQQKRMAFREQVTLYADENKQEAVLGFKARQVIDLGATYDVVDAGGSPIGSFRKDFAKSLLRSTWHIDQPGLGTVTGSRAEHGGRRDPSARRERPGCPTTSTSRSRAGRPSPWRRSGACATGTS